VRFSTSKEVNMRKTWSQSHHTDQGNSEEELIFLQGCGKERSQSHHTDQGNSETS